MDRLAALSLNEIDIITACFLPEERVAVLASYLAEHTAEAAERGATPTSDAIIAGLHERLSVLTSGGH